MRKKDIKFLENKKFLEGYSEGRRYEQMKSQCPCNGGCHNGHTPTCSEECRGQKVRHYV